jgi:hypothetical protein
LPVNPDTQAYLADQADSAAAIAALQKLSGDAVQMVGVSPDFAAVTLTIKQDLANIEGFAQRLMANLP